MKSQRIKRNLLAGSGIWKMVTSNVCMKYIRHLRKVIVDNNNNNNNNLFGKFTPKRQVMALGNALINCLNYL